MADKETTEFMYDDEPDKRPWMRGLFMIAFAICFAVAETVLALLALLQFIWLIASGSRNEALRQFGVSLGRWMAEAARYQAADTEEKPFPWKPWPSAE